MISIRRRLFIALLAATGMVWLSAVIWIQYSTRQEVSHVLDRRLEESARMVASLIGRQGLPGAVHDPQAGVAGVLGPDEPLFSRQLVCQVWGLDGSLKSESAGAPSEPLAAEAASGFSQREIRTETGPQQWRVYTYVDEALGIRVMVGDALAMRDGLVSGVVMGLLAPALLILPALALLIWLGVGRGLQPLSEFARLLRARSAQDLRPLPTKWVPRELSPMIGALNGLFARVEGQREREQDFTAFAAHELKTPLAGLKTQAQIAKMAPDEETRAHALRQILRGVERTDRLARQLLDLTAAEASEQPTGPCPKLGSIVKDVLRDLRDMAALRGITLRLELQSETEMACVGSLLAPALRNLVENALQASPEGEEVVLTAAVKDDALLLCVADRGPGIPDEDRPKITERFFRGGRPKSGTGSGLGLSIVEATALRLGGSLTLAPRADGGEEARLALPLRFQ
ncbi:sensor histidine kinase [Falsigemmobacter faecalis]|uniref:histidine kinase n=1 Tax=Falsigemmobacter faecalis TaxID=2488730 RepID=A0A3P3DHP2_9RHOB|nr:ATP-binding protein [Falsigemmobacter faecalis]RRH73789.1 histidine kinase [Falsigemmobacter faecalis]